MSITRADPKRHRALECLAAKLRSRQIKRVVTLAGAGISTSAGLPDWRSPRTGLFHNLKKYKVQYADVLLESQYFLNNPEVLFSVLKDHFLPNSLKPTLTHCFIKLLDVKGVLLRHFTQNIDGMELMTGLSPDKVVEAHGTLQRSYCTKCKSSYNYHWLVKKMEDASLPDCDYCGGLVRPDIVLFGEELSQNFQLRSFIDIPECDFLLVLGSSMLVEPFASLMLDAPPECPRLVINRSASVNSNLPKASSESRRLESDDGGGELVIAGDCDSVITDLVKLIGWEDDFNKVIREVKLRKLYGDIRSVEVGSQTPPLQAEDEIEFITFEDPTKEARCSDFCGSKTQVTSSLPKSKTDRQASVPVRAWVNVEPRVKPKTQRSLDKFSDMTIKPVTDDSQRLCERCYAIECNPKHWNRKWVSEIAQFIPKKDEEETS